MQNNSKIPRFQLKTTKETCTVTFTKDPPSVSKFSNEPSISSRKNLRRRSKSVTNLTHINAKVVPRDKKITNYVKIEQNRPAFNKSSEKMEKKIPDWDYKSRFYQLSENYASLQREHEIMTNTLAGLRRQYEMVVAENKENVRKLKDSEKSLLETLKELGNLKEHIHRMEENNQLLKFDLGEEASVRRNLHNMIQDLKNVLSVYDLKLQ